MDVCSSSLMDSAMECICYRQRDVSFSSSNARFWCMCLYPCQCNHSTGMLWVTNASDSEDGFFFWVCLFWRMLIRTYGWVESGRWTAMRSVDRVYQGLRIEHCLEYGELPMLCALGEFDYGLLKEASGGWGGG